jgi:hypothetical protein
MVYLAYKAASDHTLFRSVLERDAFSKQVHSSKSNHNVFFFQKRVLVTYFIKRRIEIHN